MTSHIFDDLYNGHADGSATEWSTGVVSGNGLGALLGNQSGPPHGGWADVPGGESPPEPLPEVMEEILSAVFGPEAACTTPVFLV